MMNKLNFLVLCFFALSGCRYGTMSTYDALKSEYEAGIERIENAKYTADKYGDIDHTVARRDHAIAYCAKIVAKRRQMGDAEERAFISNVEGALKRKVQCLKADIEWQRSQPGGGGSYAGIFYAHAVATAYSYANDALFLNGNEMRRWMNVCNSRGKIAGAGVIFDGGYANVKTRWRMFEEKPYMIWEKCEARIMSEHIFSYATNDYAIAEFGIEAESGGPSTTAESVLLEIYGGRITRHLGLHNVYIWKATVDNKTGLSFFEGTDGYGTPIRYVVDLRSMKIKGSQSVFSSEYSADYRLQFVD